MIPATSEETARYVELGLWSPTETLSDLLARNARVAGGSEAVVDAYGARLTYHELDAAASALAGALAARGIGRGDVVGVQMPNRVEASVIACAIEKLGAVITPLTTMFRDHELGYVARVTAMKALFVPGTYRRYDHDGMAQRIAAAAPALGTVVTLTEEPPPGLLALRRLLREGAGDPRVRGGAFAQPDIDPDAPAGILMTSGTEADPKAVIHTNNTLDANCRALIGMLAMDERDHIFMASPVGHGTGYGFGVRLAIHLGSKLVLQDIWDPARAAQALAEERCGYTHASTTFAQDLLELEGLAPERFPALRHFVSGGASIPPGFAARMRETMGCTLLRLYGQTEAFMTTINRPEDGDDKLDARDGRAAPGVDVAVWDERGEPVPAGHTGELVCRGPHRCRGFLNDPERTARAISPEGWLRMGDLGVMDEDGYVNVVGRTKEVISRGGYKFSPREVEELLLEHPAVKRVALVKVPDQRLGERACACVIARDGAAELRLEDLTGYLRERGLAPYKLPERLELLSEFPMTPSGKVQKFELERMLVED
jgi:acyl-CoA synthetase (AMP-forming)/AMP-acid ligase II